MADTGHGGAITQATSSFSEEILSITPPAETVEDVPTPHMGLADGAHVPYMPGDLIEGGEMVVKVSVDPDYDAPLRVVENTTLTWPLGSGLAVAAKWVFTGYTKAFAAGELLTNGRMEADLTIKVAGNIVKSDGTA